MRATYEPESNKLRIYPEGVRVDSVLTETEYSAFKGAGYRWASKQECFVCPSWSPSAEDWALELCEEIEDEDYSPTERAADRAERFEGYREKRRDEAGEHADTFDNGPQAFGHQNRARAERQALRHDRNRTKAISQWGKAEYWQQRTSGVIRNALHRAKPEVRRDRILRLEAEQRKHEKNREEYAARFNAWREVCTLDGADSPVIHKRTDDFIGISAETTPAARRAYSLASAGHCWGEYKHPRNGKTGSIYCLMTDPADPITAREAASLWLDGASDPSDTDSNSARWSAHYTLRLEYENAMLANEGGKASEVAIEPGGWFGRHQVHAVNKSPVTGRVVSVKLMAPKPWWRGEGPAPLTLQSFNIERMGAEAYRAPTDEEREAFAKAKKERKAKEKATKPASPSLINPTDEDAERLQAVWNSKAEALYKKHMPYGSGYKPTPVSRMTQAEYSDRSKGSYSNYETVEVCQHGHRPRSRYGENCDTSPVAFKIRKRYGSGGFSHCAESVVIITDKPQKPLPLNWEAVLDKVTA